MKTIFSFTALLLLVFSFTTETGFSQTRELRYSSAGNVELAVINDGRIGFIPTKRGGMWPRGSNERYIFGIGTWISALRGDSKIPSVSKTYEPHISSTEFFPGTAADLAQGVDTTSVNRYKQYRLYSSTDFDRATGKPLPKVSKAYFDWPIRNTTGARIGENYFGTYVADPSERLKYPPVFIADEDMVMVISSVARPPYTLGMSDLKFDIVQKIYFWNEGELRDGFIVHEQIVSREQENLSDVRVGIVADFDIGEPTNDHFNFYDADPSLALSYFHSDPESDLNKGYAGLMFLATPSKDRARVVNPDSRLAFPSLRASDDFTSQIGVASYEQWNIDHDPLTIAGAHSLLTTDRISSARESGDLRSMMSVGPFALAANDQAELAYCVFFNKASSGDDNEQVTSLAEKARRIRLVSPFRSVDHTSGVEQLSQAASGFSLGQNYPNPVSSSTAISYSIAERRDVVIEIKDALGKTVFERSLSNHQSGSYQLNVNTSNFPSGVYTYTLRSGSFMQSGQMSVVK